MEFPADRRYSPDHLWVGDDSDGQVMVGVTDYAQDQLGPVIYVELPEAGQKVQAGVAMGTLESAKTVSEIISPVTGLVVRVNQGLREEPFPLNQDPYGTGWLAVLSTTDKELNGLLSAQEYKNLLA